MRVSEPAYHHFKFQVSLVRAAYIYTLAVVAPPSGYQMGTRPHVHKRLREYPDIIGYVYTRRRGCQYPSFICKYPDAVHWGVCDQTLHSCVKVDDDGALALCRGLQGLGTSLPYTA